MQLLKRNKKTITYKNFLNSMSLLKDDEGFYTGEHEESYSEFKTVKAYITANRGDASEEMFGTSLDYDNVMYVELDSDINEYSMLWVNADLSQAPDYMVKRVATSLNHKAIAIKKVR